MVFYLDLILLLNFSIDYLILIATVKFLKLDYKKWRLALGALVGALYSLVFFIPSLDFYQFFLTKIILSIIIILVSIGYKDLIFFIQAFATFYLVSFLMGGGVLGIQYLFNIEHEVVNGIYVTKSSSPAMVIAMIFISFIGIWLFSKRTFISLTRRISFTQGIIDIEVHFDDEILKCKGLVDTGNQLYDPITRKPVIIVEAEQMPFLPSVLKNSYRNGQFDLDLFNRVTEQVDIDFLSRVQIIPFRTISREMQFLVCIKPNKVVVRTKEGKELSHTKVLVGLDYSKLSKDDSYQAIIHPDLITG